ncbi:MAG: hypothetical protein DRN71_05790 [Candidatus Nanohalarchaeota archaeon]|nr:MAG: hypothetical protein DRN71_05790 [Candidatus Nanohaloarchaeota archaeon]
MKLTYAKSKTPLKSLETKANKTGRNEPCLCGSGKKYKKCCLKNSES